MALAAQAGGHPHIAPRAAGLDLTTPPSKVSPLLNQADQIWNMGESPNGTDLGGVRGPDNPLTAPQPSFAALLPGGGWGPHATDAQIQHYVGSFRNRGAQTNPADDTRASFEVVAPAAIEPGKKVVVALFTQPTFAGLDAKRSPHDYPGDPNYFDLLVTGGGGPHVDVVARNLSGPTRPYRVVGVQFVPRTSFRPALFAMQRLRQVREAVKYLLTQPPYNIAATDIAYHVDCASFGGFTTQLAILFYPQEFHAGTAGAFSGAMRSVPCDFDSLVYYTSLLGMNGAGHSYAMRDTLDIPLWCSVEGTDLTSVSSTNRWLLPMTHIQRPIYFFLGDEDAVTHGTDWIPIMNRGMGQNGTQPQEGEVPFQSVGGHLVTVRWSIASKSGHGEPRPNGFKLMDNPPRDTNKLEEVLDLMLWEAYGQLVLNPPPLILPIDHANVGRKLTNQLALPSQDPSRDALGQRGVRSFTNGSRQSLLTDPPPSFRRYGQGTWLGSNESLKIRKVGNDPRASVFVGSADGFVTRLMMETKTVGGTTIQPLVEQARSKLVNGTPYALGHGVWGLAVGDVDPANAGLEVVAASYNRIALFKAGDLELIRERDLPDPADIRISAERRWEYVDPRKVQIADLIPGVLGDEIVFRTLHGHLVIMDRLLNIQHEHGEGGIVDFVIGDETTSGPRLRHPIYLLSARGHVARLEINTSFAFPDQGELAAVSHLEYGGMRDLELVPWQGQQRLGALFIPHLGDSDAIRFFATGDCSRVGQFGNIQAPAPPPETGEAPLSVLQQSPAGDWEPGFTYVAGHGGDRYVISSGDELSVWDGAEVLGHKRMRTFPPATGHGCVAAGDIDEATLGVDEVVVATSAGRVVWFKLDELLSDLSEAGLALNMTRAFVTDPTDGRVYEHRCNVSLAATWAIAPAPAAGKLNVVDAVGTWWEVDPDGKPTFVKDLGPKAMGLVNAGASSVAEASGSGGAAHLAWQTFKQQPTSPETFLASTPYVPATLPGGPWWLPIVTSGYDFRPRIWHENGHWVLPFSGTQYNAPGVTWLAWWQKAGTFTRFIQRVTYTVTGGQASVQDIWGSTQKSLAGNAAPPRFPPSHPDYVKALRSELSEVALMNMDAIRIGKVLPGDTPQVVASGMGGRVSVLDGSSGRIVAESPDYGLGGLALAVGNLNSDDRDEIVFAPFYDPIVPGTQTVRSTLRVLSGASGSLTPLGNANGVPVGEANSTSFPGYGTCGIAIVDLSPWPLLPPIGKVVIVTTLNGELVIFEAQPDGSLNSQPLLRRVVEGSIGAYGSIVVADLDQNGMPELYLAGSAGIRRFDFQ